MANPKYRHSNARSGKRRSHHFLTAPTLTRCPDCGAVKLSHQPCQACGKYKDIQYISDKKLGLEKKDKKKK